MLLPLLITLWGASGAVAPASSALDGMTNIAPYLSGGVEVMPQLSGAGQAVSQLSGTVRVYPE